MLPSLHTQAVLQRNGKFYEDYLGVELEFETDKNYGLGVLQTKDLINGFAIMKKDSTLKNGFEITSTPADYETHLTLWDDFFTGLPNNVIPTQNCGCHIHISKDGIPELSIGKILIFIHNENNRKFVKLMAGRESNEYNNYVKPRPSVKTPPDNAQENHRTAVNFRTSNGQTVEFRIFRSTREKDELLKNIDFVRALCEFAKTASIQEMKEWKKFVEYTCKNKHLYKFLYKFLCSKEGVGFLRENAPEFIQERRN